MSFRFHFRAIPPYALEVFTRYKAAWGGSSAVIVGAFIYAAVTGQGFSRSGWLMILMLAIIGAQFWHGLMQFERMQPSIEVHRPEQHFWPLKEQRGSSGTGYYFQISNISSTESIEHVRAELTAIEPEPPSLNGFLPFALHIRHLNYCVAETFMNAGCSRAFDLATGPDHNTVSQQTIIIPGIIGGDRGYTAYGIPIPFGRYHMTVRISAQHCAPIDREFDLWTDDDNFLRCVERQPSVTGAH